jgi:hypothetical protein
MKKYLLIFPITIALAIFFYPTTSISNGTGSPGGKTNSPLDGQNCTACHSGTINSGIGNATITTNIPSWGYTTGQTYTITLTGVKANCTKFGFELTAEDASNSKTGTFFITNGMTQHAANTNNTAVTHTNTGTSGNTTMSWSIDWTPDQASFSTTFYASLIFANNNGNNVGDNVFTNSHIVFEETWTTQNINNLSEKNDFTFYSPNKTIESNTIVLVYDMSGKLVLTTKEEFTTISHLKNGIYILKSEKKTQKIILN